MLWYSPASSLLALLHVPGLVLVLKSPVKHPSTTSIPFSACASGTQPFCHPTALWYMLLLSDPPILPLASTSWSSSSSELTTSINQPSHQHIQPDPITISPPSQPQTPVATRYCIPFMFVICLTVWVFKITTCSIKCLYYKTSFFGISNCISHTQLLVSVLMSICVYSNFL